MADNQAIVVPETVDAIRALTGIERDASISIAKMDDGNWRRILIRARDSCAGRVVLRRAVRDKEQNR